MTGLPGRRASDACREADLDELRRQEAALVASIPDTMVMEEKPGLRQTYILVRGDFRVKGEMVSAGVPRSLPPLPSEVPANRLALANPDAVPAGKYAKAALTALRVWDSVAGKIAAAETVRAALILVKRGEARLGVVYATDAKVEPGVVVVDTFPDNLHAPIVYPAALLTNASGDAAKVLDFLKSDAATKVFQAQGFTTVARK